MAQAEDSPDKYFISKATGKRIVKRIWPVTSPKAVVFISHGVGEHCGRYEPLALKLNELGIHVIAHDHYGHGRSEGERVDVTDFGHYSDDALQHIDEVHATNPNAKFFVFGHSMGGLIAIETIRKRPEFFTGVVISGPAIIPDPATATPLKLFAAKVFAAIMPQLQLGSVDPSFLSHDKAQVEKYQTDPLNWHGGLKARWAVNILRTMEDLRGHLERVEWPFLALQASEDKLTNKEGAKELYAKAISKDKTLKMYEGYYHEILNETVDRNEVVYSDILTWIKERM
eukprot:Opistho-2@33471